MFIYFWEQVWTFDSCDYWKHNFITNEVGSCFWEQYNFDDRGSGYPSKYMIEGIDYLDY